MLLQTWFLLSLKLRQEVRTREGVLFLLFGLLLLLVKLLDLLRNRHKRPFENGQKGLFVVPYLIDKVIQFVLGQFVAVLIVQLFNETGDLFLGKTTLGFLFETGHQYFKQVTNAHLVKVQEEPIPELNCTLGRGVRVFRKSRLLRPGGLLSAALNRVQSPFATL